MRYLLHPRAHIRKQARYPKKKVSPWILPEYKAFAQDSMQIQALILKAEKTAEDGNTYGAIKLRLKIMELDPNNYQSANSLSGLYGLLHEFTEQITWAKEAIAINPKYVMAYISLGNGFGATGDVQDAEESYKKAENIDPDSPFPPYCIAVIEENEGNIKDAINYYKRAVDRDSLFVTGYCSLAVSYAKLQDYAVAEKYINQALVLNPKSIRAQEIKGRIKDRMLHP